MEGSLATASATAVREDSNGKARSVQLRGYGDIGRNLVGVTPALIAYNLGYLTLTWGLAIGAIALFWIFPAWYTFAIAFVIVSSRQQALLNIEHECQHRKFLPTRRWNDLVGTWLAAGPVGSPYRAAQGRHLAHHRLLGTDEDPDHDLHAGANKSSRLGLIRYFIGGIAGGYAGMVLMGPPRKDRTPRNALVHDVAAMVVAQLVLFAGLTLALAWWVYPALWVLPLVTLTLLAHMVRSFVEHAITDEEMEAHSNRLISVRGGMIERNLISPYYMNYHAEHHLLPSVPARRLKGLQTRFTQLEDAPTVLFQPTYRSALRRYVRTLSD
jgi:fatty acid desaturase